MTLKILYAGTPEIAVHPLDALVQSPRVQVVGVLTREDAPVGRKRILTPSPVAQRAEELGLPIVKANRWSPETQQQIAPLGAEAAAVVAYGTILPQHALDMLPYGWVICTFRAARVARGRTRTACSHGGRKRDFLEYLPSRSRVGYWRGLRRRIHVGDGRRYCREHSHTSSAKRGRAVSEYLCTA